jgi:hypothetical protein
LRVFLNSVACDDLSPGLRRDEFAKTETISYISLPAEAAMSPRGSMGGNRMASHMPLFNASAASGSSPRTHTRAVTFTITGLICVAIWIVLVTSAVHIISRHMF